MKLFLWLLFFTLPLRASEKVDLVIFSFDRPLQLYALLESCEEYMKGLGDVHVTHALFLIRL